MQATAGPAGPPAEGPTGQSAVVGPTGSPQGPAGPPSDVNPAQFDPLAEIEDARARRQNREESLERLQKKRNSARVNVYLFLALTIVFAGFSFFPVTYGDTDLDPFPAGQNAEDAKSWITSEYWKDGGYEDKIWDGSDTSQTVLWDGYIPPPLPDMGSTSSVRFDLKVDGYRYTGNTTFRVGIADGTVDDCASLPWSEFSEDSYYHHTDDLPPLSSVEFTLHAQPGQKCLVFAWDEPISGSSPLATVDVEMSVYWPRILSVPAATVTFLFAGFAFIGAQKSGRAFKAIKYPEGKPKQKVEEEVLEAAEAEQREQIDAPVVEQPENTDTHEVAGPSLAEAAASPEQDDVEPSPEAKEDADDEATEEPQDAAAAYTDEQLLGAGWSQEQIDAMRGGQA